MTITSFQAAKAMGHFSGWNLSNLKIQKLLYIAHMLYMGENNKEPLINEEFEAWDYGPVLPSLYHELKIFGSSSVRDIFFKISIPSTNKEIDIIKQTVERLSVVSSSQLVTITHACGGAWDKNYRQGSRGTKIPNKDILEEYIKLSGKK